MKNRVKVSTRNLCLYKNPFTYQNGQRKKYIIAFGIFVGAFTLWISSQQNERRDEIAAERVAEQAANAELERFIIQRIINHRHDDGENDENQDENDNARENL